MGKPNTLRVRAVEGRKIPRLHRRAQEPRWLGYDAAGAILPNGEVVPFDLNYLRAVAHGDLELIADEES